MKVQLAAQFRSDSEVPSLDDMVRTLVDGWGPADACTLHYVLPYSTGLRGRDSFMRRMGPSETARQYALANTQLTSPILRQ